MVSKAWGSPCGGRKIPAQAWDFDYLQRIIVRRENSKWCKTPATRKILSVSKRNSVKHPRKSKQQEGRWAQVSLEHIWTNIWGWQRTSALAKEEAETATMPFSIRTIFKTDGINASQPLGVLNLESASEKLNGSGESYAVK